ncbi:MAG: RagB/SusD family nutrient uptake outer membrane protein [Saprospiraceae bacterium]|nr:RagB/SusD family nutrient uptake outer membrane protein [Saprospiraceae bacterium]
MKIMQFKNIALTALLSLLAVSCFKDLNTTPIDEDEITSAAVYDNPAAYKQVLAKLYAGLALSGQEGPEGRPDIAGINEGFSTYLRQYWKAQELPTDEAVIAWNDGNLSDYHQQDWDANNEFIAATYNRMYYQISLCNEYLRETTEEKLNSRGVDAALKAEIATYRAEARFLRALSYWHALDLFRNVPFVTENDNVGSFFPPQYTAEQLFNYIESELLAIDADLVNPQQNEYGRADKACAWTLLAKLYLNSEVYTGRPRYADCENVCTKVINVGYGLQQEYAQLFMADNDLASGIIFPVNFDGLKSQTWGGMTFLVHAAVGGSMKTSDFGIDGGWGGLRATSALVNKFTAAGVESVTVAASEGNTANYPKIYVPGGYQGWDPATAANLTSPNNDNTYEGYIYFPEDNSPFKFTLGPNWNNNFGDNGANGTLEPTGANITAPTAGFYKINVNLTTSTYTLLKTDWGLIGDATAGGWGEDQNMTYNATSGAWEITAKLIGGKDVKFRANDGWDLNYGDNGPDALLEAGGANIKIPADGTYTIKLFLDKPDYTYSIEKLSLDSRYMFYTDGQSLEINDISLFTDGYAVTKFKNVTSTGAAGKHPTFVDTDYPLFRIEDVFLMMAEAILRNNEPASNALPYVNSIRQRAYGGGTAANITAGELTLDFILDERARELYWEGHRRTDLVRYGKFSETTYLWPWKGGVKAGISTSKHLDIFPIPASDRGANPNLDQNDGY